MPVRITADDLDRLEDAEPDEDDPEFAAWHRATAVTLESWGSDAAAFELVADELSTAEVLLAAAEHFAMAGDVADALRLGQVARRHPSAEPFEAHAQLVGFHLADADPDAATALADEVRAAGAVDPELAEAIAMEFDIADEFEQAERWYTIAVRGLEAEGDRESEAYEFALIGRHRARRELGAPIDAIDEDAERFLELDLDED